MTKRTLRDSDMQIKAGITFLLISLTMGSVTAFADEASERQSSERPQPQILSIDPDCEIPSLIIPPADLSNLISRSITMCMGPMQSFHRMVARDLLNEGPLTAEQAFQERVRGDKNICSCFRSERDKFFFGSFKASESVGLEGLHTTFVRKADEERITALREGRKRRQDAQRSGSALQWSLISADIQGDRERIELLGKSSSASDIESVVKDYYPDNSGNSEERRKWTDAFRGEVSSSNFHDTEEELKSCVTYREFLKFQMVPQEDEFYEFLGRPGDFKQEDWDYNIIRKRVSDLTSNKVFDGNDYQNIVEGNFPDSFSDEDAKELQSLMARMRYLNSNPLFKNLFAIRGSAEIKQKQTDLFNKMKQRLLPKDLNKCLNNSGNKNACYVKVHEDKNLYPGFIKEAHDIIGDGSIITQIFNQQEQDRVRGIRESLQLVRERREGGFDLNKALEASGLDKADCASSNYQSTTCVPAWGKYCGMLARAEENEELQSKVEAISPFLEKLENDLVALYNPDRKSNKVYDDFVKDTCDVKRGGQTYAEFVDAYCGRSRSKPECTNPALRKDLVGKWFEKNTSLSENGGDPRQQAMSIAMKGFFKHNTFQSYTKEEAAQISYEARVLTPSTEIQRRLASSTPSSFGGQISSAGARAAAAAAAAGATSTSDSTDSRSPASSSGNEFNPSSMASAGVFNPSFLGDAAAVPAADQAANLAPDQQRTLSEMARVRDEAQTLENQERSIAEQIERARQEGRESAQIENMQAELARVQGQLRENQSLIQKLSEQLRQQEQAAAAARTAQDSSERRSDSRRDDDDEVRAPRRQVEGGASEVAASQNQNRQTTIPDALPQNGGGVAGGGAGGSARAASAGVTAAATGVPTRDSVIMEALSSRNTPTLQVAESDSASARPVVVTLPSNVWKEYMATGDPKLIAPFLSKVQGAVVVAPENASNPDTGIRGVVQVQDGQASFVRAQTSPSTQGAQGVDRAPASSGVRLRDLQSTLGQ